MELLEKIYKRLLAHTEASHKFGIFPIVSW